jgi:hypothetical protein
MTLLPARKSARVGRGWREYDGMNEKKLDECCSLLAKKLDANTDQKINAPLPVKCGQLQFHQL